jgi:hypothetical protein
MQDYLDLIEEQYEGDREFDTHEIPWGLLNQD